MAIALIRGREITSLLVPNYIISYRTINLYVSFTPYKNIFLEQKRHLSVNAAGELVEIVAIAEGRERGKSRSTHTKFF